MCAVDNGGCQLCLPPRATGSGPAPAPTGCWLRTGVVSRASALLRRTILKSVHLSERSLNAPVQPFEDPST